MSITLTRRQAVAALAAAGVTAGGATVIVTDGDADSDGQPDDGPETESSPEDIEALLALTDVLYPQEVTATAEFVETYVYGRLADDSTSRDSIRDALGVLNERAEVEYGAPFVDLDVSQRDDFLSTLELSTTDPNPDGTEIEQIRYYLVNDLLFALYATPTGGELVGAENPTGYPGGLEAYQREPRS